MSIFKPGDLVQVIELGIEETGMVGSIVRQCGCFHSLVIALGVGQRVYAITCSDKCFVESALKKIGGERPKETVEETHDEPVAA